MKPTAARFCCAILKTKTCAKSAKLLGASEDAAQKRVSRAVERLREFFSKRNVTIGASGLAVLISANAVQAAPVGLAATISAAAVLAGTAVSHFHRNCRNQNHCHDHTPKNNYRRDACRRHWNRNL